MEFEKNTKSSHSIESEQVLVDKVTGRVVAVFYNDYDLDEVLDLQDKLREAEAKLSWAMVPEGARF